MLDTGCSRMVCGARWYVEFKRALKKLTGLDVVEFCDTESFRFGPGPIVPSLCASLIPVGIGGKTVIFRITIVEGDVPLLMSHAAMKDLDVSYHARSQLVHSGELEVCIKTECFDEGHPMVNLLDFSEDPMKDMKFDLSETLQEVRLNRSSSPVHVLSSNPQREAQLVADPDPARADPDHGPRQGAGLEHLQPRGTPQLEPARERSVATGDHDHARGHRGAYAGSLERSPACDAARCVRCDPAGRGWRDDDGCAQCTSSSRGSGARGRPQHLPGPSRK